METYIFLLQCGNAATMVQVTVSGQLFAYMAVTLWVNSRPGLLEDINYISIERVKTGRALIHIPPEELKELHFKTL